MKIEEKLGEQDDKKINNYLINEELKKETEYYKKIILNSYINTEKYILNENEKIKLNELIEKYEIKKLETLKLIHNNKSIRVLKKDVVFTKKQMIINEIFNDANLLLNFQFNEKKIFYDGCCGKGVFFDALALRFGYSNANFIGAEAKSEFWEKLSQKLLKVFRCKFFFNK